MASPEPQGADAFLPALTEELIWSPDIGETQLDVEFLMELLDPEELLGEGEPPSPERQDPTAGAGLGVQTASPRSRRKGRRTQGPSGSQGSRESCANLSFLPLVGYYLTTWFGALHHIAHYQPEGGRSPRGLSSEASASLRQWHRRRTLQRPGRSGAQVTAGWTAGRGEG